MAEIKKSKKNKNIISINPMQDDLEETSPAGIALARMGRPVMAVKEAIKKGAQAVKKGTKKVGEKIYKTVGAESKFSKALMSKPKRTMAAIGASGVAKEIKKLSEGHYDKDISETEGSFAKGGLVRSGKPRLAKKGWR